MAEEQQQALASDLYNAFLQNLRPRGLGLVSQDELARESRVCRVAQESVVRSSPLMVLNMMGSDTGTVLHTRTVAAPGLCVLQGSLRGAMGPPGFLESLTVRPVRPAEERPCSDGGRGANPPGDTRGRGPRRATPGRHASEGNRRSSIAA